MVYIHMKSLFCNIIVPWYQFCFERHIEITFLMKWCQVNCTKNACEILKNLTFTKGQLVVWTVKQPTCFSQSSVLGYIRTLFNSLVWMPHKELQNNSASFNRMKWLHTTHTIMILLTVPCFMRFLTSLVPRIIPITYRFFFVGNNELKAHIIKPHATYKISKLQLCFNNI